MSGKINEILELSSENLSKAQVVRAHRENYNDSNVASQEIRQTSKLCYGDQIKTKHIESTRYKNGVTKNKLVGISKGANLWGREK